MDFARVLIKTKGYMSIEGLPSVKNNDDLFPLGILGDSIDAGSWCLYCSDKASSSWETSSDEDKS